MIVAAGRWRCKMGLNAVSDRFVASLAADLPQDVLRPVAPGYLTELRGKWTGQGGVLALPRNVQDVSTILRHAHVAEVPVVPYGGGTGLVGGQVMPEGPAPVILSLERMNAIRSVDPVENVLVAEAGAILANLHDAAESADRLFPLAIAASGTAQIGGNLATNAGGVNVLRYGNTRDLCLGLEIVLADGRIWNGLGRLRKDNTGYDLKNLMIGSEGTLGVITAASLKLFPKPASFGTSIMVVPSPEAALDLLTMTRAHVAEAVSTFELISGIGLQFLAQHMPDLRQPFGDIPEWCVLIDLGLGAGQDGREAIEQLFCEALEAGLVTDGVLAESGGQRDTFWALRENIPVGNRAVGAIASHDVSLPLRALPEFIERASVELSALSDVRINCFGHVGDGNLHFNLFPAIDRQAADYADIRDALTARVHELVGALEGSISAEHGIGRAKVDELQRYKDPVALQMMRAVKTALDPQGIMNPGVVLK